MSANFTPNIGPYGALRPFRFWCQKILPLVYDDSLSYMELLNKTVDYLNKTMEDVDTVTQDMSAMLAAYNSLQNYVNEYFNNLDLTAEVEIVLDKMAENGTLSNLLSPLVGEQIGAVVAEQIDDVVANQIYNTVAEQIDDVVTEQIGDYVPTAVTSWLNENVDPVGSAVIIDSTLSISGAAADAEATGNAIVALRNALDIYNGIAFPALNGKKTIEISTGTETGYYSNGTKVENARFKCIEFILPYNAKKISYTYANAANAGAGCILSANRATIRTLSGTAEAHEYDIPSNACFVELNFFDGTYVEKYEITVEELATESAISGLASDVNDIEETISGEYDDITFTPTGSGYINTSNQLVYTNGGTGFNQIMIINDLPTAGLSEGTNVTVKAGYLDNSGGCVGFSTSAITESGTIRLSNVVPWASTENSQEITFTIPSDAIAIAFFNRSQNEANPTIKAQTAIGIIAEISALNDKIDDIDENLFNVNNRTIFAKNIISKPLNFNGKTITVFGDSIAYGYASNPLAPITNCWINLFATKTGATIVNQAVSGSTLATRTDHSNSIYETIANYSGTTPDIIIVAGGVNDYANNVPLGNYDDAATSTVYGALNNIVSTLARDLTGIPVIFITPINCTRANDEEKLTYFNGIRNAVFEVAAKNNHMVVNGADLGFPLVTGRYQEDVLYDGLHPTATGHKMYCDAVCGILL